MSPRNPFDLVKFYKAQAEMHSNQFWSEMLSEAAEMILTLANENLHYITEGNPAMLAKSNGLDPVPPPVMPRRRIPLPQADLPGLRRRLPPVEQESAVDWTPWTQPKGTGRKRLP